MTIAAAASLRSPTYIADGVETVFAFPFPVNKAAEVEVLVDGVAVLDGFEVLFTSAGGTVGFEVPPPAGATVDIIDRPEVSQLRDYTNQAGVYPDDVERALDKLTRITRRNGYDLLRSLKMPVGVDTPATLFRGASGTVPMWDANGNLIVGPDSAVIAGAATILSQAQTAAATATAAAATAVAAAGSQFDDLQDLLSSTGPIEVGAIVSVRAERLSYEVVSSGAHLTTAGGVGLRFVSASGRVTPDAFGAVPFVDVDQSAAFNAMSGWVRTQYDTTGGAFRTGIDLKGLLWRVDQWDLTNIRQPAFTFGNGTIYTKLNGGIAVDCAGTNNARILGEFSIEAPDYDSHPAVGMYIGRAEFGGVAGPIAPDWAGQIRIDGYFRKAGFVNLASEVSKLLLHVTNHSRSLSAVCLIHTGTMATLDEYVGGLSSDFATLPPASSGNHSNILHDYGCLVCKRRSDVTLPILNIEQTNPVRVTVDPARLATARYTNGTVIFFHDHNGMPELKNKRVKVANLNTVAGTFTLTDSADVPINGTAFGAWTGGGNVWISTGPAAIFGLSHAVRTAAAYFLAYGSPTIILDAKNGTISDIELDFQQEASPDIGIRIDVGAAAAVIRRLKVNMLSASQSFGVAPIHVNTSGGGTLRLDNPEITLVGHANVGSLPNGLIHGRGNVSVRNGVFNVPYKSDISPVGWASFSGIIRAADPAYCGTFGVRVAPLVSDTASMSDINHPINTDGKQPGLGVWNATLGKTLYANNALAGGTWKDGDGTVVITPS